MKKNICALLILISSFTTLQAQNLYKVQDLLSKGNKVFIEVVDKKKNTDGAYESFKKHLLSEEWNRWILVDTKENATFICRLLIDKKGFNPMSFTSNGARVRTEVEILTPEGKRVWMSQRQQGNVSVFTGGNALADAMRKVIRRSLKMELYGEIE